MSFSSKSNYFDFTSISNNVGKNCANKPLDVLSIQHLLNGSAASFTGREILKADGLYGANTLQQISLFQKEIVKLKFPDGIISPHKATHKTLLSKLAPSYQLNLIEHSSFFQKQRVDLRKFIALYTAQFPKEKSVNDLANLLRKMLNDSDITDIRWVAYMLATVKRECAATWQPIEEWGQGKNKPYGNAIKVLDPDTQKEKNNVYYGRGYVQLTWDYNYSKVGQKLGLGNRLYIHPEHALEPMIAYKILSVGMREGLFAKARLVQYLSGSRTDYVGARNIINGQDHAHEIAKTAADIEQLIFAATQNAIITPNFKQSYASYA
jgi:predicted chitinase